MTLRANKIAHGIVRKGSLTNLTTNKKAIDAAAPRHTAVEMGQAVLVAITGGPGQPYAEEGAKHSENAAVGTKLATYPSTVLVDQADVAGFVVGEEITLVHWGDAADGLGKGDRLEDFLAA
ncbi:hypothetical protein B0I37DRAFT_442448 [Chaetomium sp. MPI-CAGE-AT-0009]|nr:hypothetical protein B0I37DRAFT_442448 [Chaetomium sp. MPI-CAGE-AT-0009]